MNHNNEGTNIKLYKRRWIVILAVCIVRSVIVFNNTGFGLVADISVAYYDVTYPQADWIVLSNCVGSFLGSSVLTWLIFQNFLAFRSFLIVASTFLLIDCVLILSSLIKSSLFFLLVIGQVFNGIGKSIIFTIPSAFAVHWFPENQVALALGISIAGSSIGSLLAYALLPNVMHSPELHSISGNVTSFAISNYGLVTDTPGTSSSPTVLVSHCAKYTLTTANWWCYDQKLYGIIFGFFAVVTLMVIVFSCFYVTDKPPLPPSVSQLHERIRDKNVPRENFSFKEFLISTKDLLFNSVFIGYSIAYLFVFVYFLLEDVMIQQIVASILPSLKKQKTQQLASFVMLAYSFGSFVGNFVSGKILDTFKRYRLQASIGTGITFLSSLITLTGCFFAKVYVMCLGMMLLGFCGRIGGIPLIDGLLQHSYPANGLLVINWLVLTSNLAAVITVYIARQLFLHFGSLTVLILHSAALFVSIIICSIVEPRLNRLDSEHRDVIENSSEDVDPLLQ